MTVGGLWPATEQEHLARSLATESSADFDHSALVTGSLVQDSQSHVTQGPTAASRLAS